MYYHETMELDEAREYFDDKIKEIQIGHDIDKGAMMVINSQLDELYNDVTSDYSFWKTRLEVIDSKINQVEKGEGAVGTNPEKRKARSIKIAQYFPKDHFNDMRIPADYDYESYDGDVWNLYEMKEQSIAWFNLFQNVLNAIDFKSRRMIIVASALKIDGLVNRF